MKEQLKYCCDIDQPVLLKAFAKRDWMRVEQDHDWNIYWYEQDF